MVEQHVAYQPEDARHHICFRTPRRLIAVNT